MRVRLVASDEGKQLRRSVCLVVVESGTTDAGHEEKQNGR
jgi:hypothetical protein